MMANARVIRKNFFNDPFLSRYNVEQLFFLIGLTCASDDYGTFWWKPENLKSEIYPSRKKQTKWIEKQLNLFLNDQVLCKYNENNIEYGHFPQWFDKGFCLKQRLDHPKEEQHPDCNIHLMSNKKPRKSRESSRSIESNINKDNLIKPTNGKKYKYYPSDFKKDVTGNAYLGYCIKCNKSDFYEKFELFGKSNCCSDEIVPKRSEKCV